MPRRQPPRGYIRSKDVQEVLNISSAMIRIYVQKGKIKHLVPPGGTQGFYLESDVRKLANELNAYLSFEEDKEHVKLVRAIEKDIPACLAITRALFANDDENARTTPPERIATWIKKNPQVAYVLIEGSEEKDRNVIGYAYALPMKSDNKKIEEILRADLLGEVNVTSDDIEEYKPGNEVMIYVAAIGMRPDLDENKRKFYGSILIRGFIDEIVKLGKKGIVLNEILAGGATRQGIRLLQAFGFSEIIAPKPGKRIFSLKIEESGSNVAEQYRQAFSEWQNDKTL